MPWNNDKSIKRIRYSLRYECQRKKEIRVCEGIRQTTFQGIDTDLTVRDVVIHKRKKKRAWKSPAVTLPYLRVAWPDFFVPHWRKLEGSFSQHPSIPKGRKPINTMRQSPKKMRPTNSSGSPSFLPPYHLIALFSKEQRFFCCSQFQYLLLHLFKPVFKSRCY